MGKDIDMVLDINMDIFGILDDRRRINPVDASTRHSAQFLVKNTMASACLRIACPRWSRDAGAEAEAAIRSTASTSLRGKEMYHFSFVIFIFALLCSFLLI